MARLGRNVHGISKARWPGEDDYKTDGLFRRRKPARSSNNISQKNSQLCGKGSLRRVRRTR